MHEETLRARGGARRLLPRSYMGLEQTRNIFLDPQNTVLVPLKLKFCSFALAYTGSLATIAAVSF